MSVLVYGNGESRKVWDTSKSYTGLLHGDVYEYIEIVKLII